MKRTYIRPNIVCLQTQLQGFIAISNPWSWGDGKETGFEEPTDDEKIKDFDDFLGEEEEDEHLPLSRTRDVWEEWNI